MLTVGWSSVFFFFFFFFFWNEVINFVVFIYIYIYTAATGHKTLPQASRTIGALQTVASYFSTSVIIVERERERDQLLMGMLCFAGMYINTLYLNLKNLIFL
jgi:hypothetical protein